MIRWQVCPTGHRWRAAGCYVSLCPCCGSGQWHWENEPQAGRPS